MPSKVATPWLLRKPTTYGLPVRLSGVEQVVLAGGLDEHPSSCPASINLTTSEPSGCGWTAFDSIGQRSRVRRGSGPEELCAGVAPHRFWPLFAAFGGCEAVDPLVSLGAREFAQGFADTTLKPGDTVLAPELLGESLEEVDLAFSRLPGSAPTPPGSRLRGIFYRLGFVAARPFGAEPAGVSDLPCAPTTRGGG